MSSLRGRPRLFGHDLLDYAFVAALKPGLAGLAVGAGPAVLHGLVGALAVIAPGDRRDRFKLQRALFQHRVLFFEIIPGVCEKVRHYPRDFADLQRHPADF